MNVSIIINSEKKSFFCALGNLLRRNFNCNVTYIARDIFVEDYINEFNNNNNNIVRSDFVINSIQIPKNVTKQAVHYEKKYSVLFSYLFSMDRALGQGFFHNVGNIPHIKRSTWSYKKKLVEMIKKFILYESLINDCDILIQQYPDPLITSICNYFKCKNFSLVTSRFGDRYMWSDDGYLTNNFIKSDIKKLVKSNFVSNKKINYPISGAAGLRLNLVDNSFYRSIVDAINNIYNDTKKILRGGYNNSYTLYGWLPNSFIRWNNARYLEKISIYPGSITETKFVYVTLNIEPEVSLYMMSPEFTNVYESIVVLSKSLPSDVVIVVKEHPCVLAVRTKKFYQSLLKIPNVKLASVNSVTLDWVKISTFVCTITGSVGTEAVYNLKPVLSFGKHQLINYLPSVEYVSNYDETKKSVTKLIGIANNDKILNVSRSCLHEVILKYTVELPEYKKVYSNSRCEYKTAKKALNNLFLQYPNIFKDI